MAEPRPHIFDQTPDSLAALCADWGLPRYRAQQVLEWVYRKGVADPAQMSNLSKSDRALLAEKLCFLRGTQVGHQLATDGTQKLLVDWGASEDNGALNVLAGPSNQTECVMIPAERVTVQQLIDAGRYYFKQTGREVTLEYILLGGVNDQAEQAHELAKVARTLRSNINLIRYNEVAGLPYHRPTGDSVHHFQRILREAGINTHIRASRGRDIAAACGQLRHEAQEAT